MEAALAGLTARLPNTTIVDRAKQHADVARLADQETAINYLFVAILAMFVTVAMVNSLVLATGERAREFALMRLFGATPRQVQRMIRWETIVLASYGTVLGLVVAAATLVPFSIGIADTPTPSVPIWFLALVVVGALAMALAATEIPTRLALRNDPTEIAARTG